MKRVVQQRRREAERGGERGVERGQLQLLVERDQEAGVQSEDRRPSARARAARDRGRPPRSGGTARTRSRRAAPRRCPDARRRRSAPIRITAMLNRAGKTRPIEASSATSRVRAEPSTRTTVSTPIAAAATISSGDVESLVTKKPSTMPSSTVWLIASLMSAMRRSTRKTPGSAHASATMTATSWISSVMLIRCSRSRSTISFACSRPLGGEHPARAGLALRSRLLGERVERHRHADARPHRAQRLPPCARARACRAAPRARTGRAAPRPSRISALLPALLERAPRRRPRSGANSSETITIAVTAEHDRRAGRRRRGAELLASAPVSAARARRTARTAPPSGRARSRPLPGRGRRRHDHRAHQHDADRLQPDHDREHEQRREQHVERTHREAERRAELAVEREQLELLPEQDDGEQRDRAERRHHHHVALEQRRGLAEEERVEAGLRARPAAAGCT